MSPAVAGARGRVTDPRALVQRAREWAAARGGEIQLLNADLILGEEHLVVAAEHAARAFAEGTQASEGIGLETLVYAAAERQIAAALARVGLREGTERVAVIAWGLDPAEVLPELGLVRDDTVLESTDAKLAAFGFTAAELDTVPRGRRHELVFERMALVDVLRR